MPVERYASTKGEDALLKDPEVKEPPRYAIYLHNDDYTTMEFVVRVLMEVFYKKREEAVDLMLKVHNDGQARCGAYVKEIAVTKQQMVHSRAREAGFPLLCTLEQE